MAKTLKQILDGVKSSKIKTKDILGDQPGVDYSPKAEDERKFADKHKIEKHADRVGNGDDVYQAANVKQDTTARHGHKSRDDEKVYEAVKCNMTEDGKLCEVHGMKQCPGKVLKEKPVKEEAVQVDELMVRNYISGAKGKSAQVHKNMNAGDYTVRKMADGKEIGSSRHDDSSAAHTAAKKHIGEEAELEEKAIANSKHTMLVTMKKSHIKDTKTGGGVMRIKKSEYDPKKHDLAEEDEINELSTNKLKSYASKAKRSYDDIKKVKTTDADETSSVKNRMMQNRTKGVNRAMNRLVMSQESHDDGIDLKEREMTDSEMKKREHIVKGMKKKLSDFRSRYGKRAKDVMYATATKQAMKEDLAQPLIGATGNQKPEPNIYPSDDSAEMAKTGLKAIANKAAHLAMQMSDDMRVEPWVQAKVAQAKEMITAVHDYMVFGGKKEEQSAPAVTPITLPDFSVDVNTGRNV